MRTQLVTAIVLCFVNIGSASAQTNDLLRRMDGFRKEILPAENLSEMNGFSINDVEGKSFTMTHLSGVARRLGVTSKTDCILLLSYLDDADPKIRFIAADAIERVLNCYPGGMSASDILNIDTDGHREMVTRFVEKLDRWNALPPDAEPNDLVVGEWSEPMNDVRGRLVIAEGRTLHETTIETVIFLELQNAADAVGAPKDIYFDASADSIHVELLNSDGKPVAAETSGRSGGNPASCWLTLPHNSRIRTPISPYGFGRPRATGLLLPFTFDSWLVPVDSTGSYTLTVQFTSHAQQTEGHANAWQAALKLNAKIALHGEQKPK